MKKSIVLIPLPSLIKKLIVRSFVLSLSLSLFSLSLSVSCLFVCFLPEGWMKKVLYLFLSPR